jgi:hypothetical protein
MSTKRTTHSARLVFAALALLLIGSATAAEPLPPTPERYFPNDDLIGPAAGDQLAPAISRGGNTILTVWTEKRALPAGVASSYYETSSDIVGMRLDGSGNTLDAVPLVE